MSTYPRKHKSTLGAFICRNRRVIDQFIIAALGRDKVTLSADKEISDAERRLWVLNDEGLYLWARREGVNI